MTFEESQKILQISSSYEFLFEKGNERNKRRYSQFSKIKKSLSQNILKKEKNNIIKSNNKIGKNKEKKNVDIINVFNLIINKYNKEYNTKKNEVINVITKNKNNQSKELKIKNKNIINNQLLAQDNINSITPQIKNNIPNFNEFNFMDDNEFALNFLTSKNKSFIQLGNNLITKVKMQNNDFTESYILALGLNEQNKPKEKYINFNNIEIIKEEKENDFDKKEINREKINIIKIGNSSKNFNYTNKYIAKIKKIKRNRMNLSFEKNKKIVNKINNLLLTENQNRYRKPKIIKLNLNNYDNNYMKMNIEPKNKTININKGTYIYNFINKNQSSKSSDMIKRNKHLINKIQRKKLEFFEKRKDYNNIKKIHFIKNNSKKRNINKCNDKINSIKRNLSNKKIKKVEINLENPKILKKYKSADKIKSKFN